MTITETDDLLRIERHRRFASLIAIIPLIPTIISLSVGFSGTRDIVFILVGLGFAAFTVLAFVYAPRHALLEFDREDGSITETTRIFRRTRRRQFDLARLEAVRVHHKRSRSRGGTGTHGYKDMSSDGGGGGSVRIRLVFAEGPIDILNLQLSGKQARDAVDRINAWRARG